MKTRLLHVTLALCLFGVPALAQQDSRVEYAHQRSTQLLESDPTMPYDPTTLLVGFKPSQTEPERESIRRLVGGERLHGFRSVEGLELMETQMEVESAIRVLAPYVEYAEPNWVQRADQTIPNDQFFSLQWGCHNTGQTIQGNVGVADADIDAVEAWDITTGSASFVIANIDTGVDWDHPDLAANIWSNPGEIAGNGVDDDGNGYVDDVRGWDFYSNDSNPNDEEGHGSHTAGTIGAVGGNGIGVAGVNWNCSMVPLRFLGPQGGFTSDAILAVEYCTTMGIKVSNNSWGGGGFSTALFNAINASKSVGHVFVAAAGNSGVNNDSSPHYPSSYNLDNIISVAATDNRDNLALEQTWGSNYGAVSVDLGAPGVDIASTWANAGYVWNGGTSMATPHVTGVVALVYAQNPGWSYSQVVGRIFSTVRATSAMSAVTSTGGVLNAFAAVTGGGGDITPPANPTGLGATAGDATVSLDWNDNGEGDLAGYRVYRSTTSGGPYGSISGLLGSSAFNDNSVVNGTTYFYVVTAEDTSGNESGNSGQVSATPTATPDTTPPANPTGLGATAGDATVSLDWNDNGEGDLAGYRVYRSTTSGGPYGSISGLLGSSAFNDNSVVNGTTYFYVVTAEDNSGNESGNSGQVSATPQAAPGGQIDVLFADGFESGNFSAGGWSTSGSPFVTTAADQGGIYGARIRRTSWIQRSISTVGYDTIELSYARRTRGLDSSERLYVEYWNGSIWVAIETTRSTSWAFQTFALGADANDNSNFAIRFRTNASRNNERADVDDIELVGTTL